MNPGLRRLLDDPAAARVMAALGDGADESRIVGGAVRDGLIDSPIRDIDIATVLEPTEAMRLLRGDGLKVVPTGLTHGTITAVVDGRGFEVTTLRRDIATDGRHAEVAFTDDWEEDAARRDFTFNALSLDRTGALHDYFDGARDLAASEVRFVGDASIRVTEDYLRILRFFRFFAWYGAGAPNHDALAACRAGAPGLERISAERIQAELLKLLAAPNPCSAITAMADAGVLSLILGDAAAPSGLLALRQIEQDQGLAPDPILRLAALAPGAAGHMAALAGRLRLSNAAGKRLKALARPYADGIIVEAETLYRQGASLFRNRAILACALEQAPMLACLKAAEDWRAPTFPIAGRDLLKAGASPGPGLGAILAGLEAWWISGGFKATKAAVLTEAQARLQRGDDDE